MDCTLPGSPVHGIFQARILGWVAISFSRGSSRPQDQTWVSQTAGRLFTVWATREFIGRTDAKAEALTLWPPDATSQLIGEDPDVGKQKGMTEDKMVGWHHLLNGHESEQTLGDGEGQGSVWSMGSWRVGHNWVTEQQQSCFRDLVGWTGWFWYLR